MYDSRDRLSFAIRRLVYFSSRMSQAFPEIGSANLLVCDVLEGAWEAGAAELNAREDGLGPFEAFDFSAPYLRLLELLEKGGRRALLDTNQLPVLIGEIPEALADVAARAIGRVLRATYRSLKNGAYQKANPYSQIHGDMPLEQLARESAGEEVSIPCTHEFVQKGKERLQLLSSFEREVIRLRWAHDLTHQQIADHLRVSRYAVLRAEKRARKRLQENDAGQEFVDSDQWTPSEPQQSPKQCPGKPRKDPKRAGDRDAGEQAEEGPDENHRGRSHWLTGAPACCTVVRVADRGRKQNKRPRRDPHPPVFLMPFSEHLSPRFPRPNHTASTRKGQIAMRVYAGWRRNITSRSAA